MPEVHLEINPQDVGKHDEQSKPPASWLTAAEAKRLSSNANSVTGSYLRKETETLLNEIADLANRGHTNLKLFGDLPLIIRQRLLALGYVIVTTDPRPMGFMVSTGSYTIYWE